MPPWMASNVRAMFVFYHSLFIESDGKVLCLYFHAQKNNDPPKQKWRNKPCKCFLFFFFYINTIEQKRCFRIIRISVGHLEMMMPGIIPQFMYSNKLIARASIRITIWFTIQPIKWLKHFFIFNNIHNNHNHNHNSMQLINYKNKIAKKKFEAIEMRKISSQDSIPKCSMPMHS